jgi:hypothetical protein
VRSERYKELCYWKIIPWVMVFLVHGMASIRWAWRYNDEHGALVDGIMSLSESKINMQHTMHGRSEALFLDNRLDLDPNAMPSPPTCPASPQLF